MNLKALNTALVLAGTSTAALPDVRDHHDDASARVDRDHRITGSSSRRAALQILGA